MIVIKTYDEILMGICDEFDALISPRRIRRSNTNIIYLLLKAIAKGYELINNTAASLSSKFDPLRCDADDLDSVAALVGTSRREGTGSGLYVTVRNANLTESRELPAGDYYYDYTSEVSFVFQVPSAVTLGPDESVSYIAMSDAEGSYAVTEIRSLPVRTDSPVSGDIRFSCASNVSLMGMPEESLPEFRERLSKGTYRQNALFRLEDDLRELPYVFDAKVVYNNTGLTVDAGGGVAVPNAEMAVFVSGEARNDIARIISEHIICPTVRGPSGIELHYDSPFFASGSHKVYVNRFVNMQYDLLIKYQADPLYVNIPQMTADTDAALREHFNIPVRKSTVRESEFYGYLASLNITGVDILGLELSMGGVPMSYIEVPPSYIPQLRLINFQHLGVPA